MTENKTVDELTYKYLMSLETDDPEDNDKAFRAGYAARDTEINQLTFELDKSIADHQKKIIVLEQALAVAEKEMQAAFEYFDATYTGASETWDPENQIKLSFKAALEKIEAIKLGVK